VRRFTSPDEWLTWNGIFGILGRHLGREPHLLHVPSAAILRADADWGASVWGDKAHSMIFDNSKLRSLVPEFKAKIPFAQGASDIVDWYREDPARCQVDPAFDALQDRLAGIYTGALNEV
jgi:nucleoside-diphosphate-sugar epimerase